MFPSLQATVASNTQILFYFKCLISTTNAYQVYHGAPKCALDRMERKLGLPLRQEAGEPARGLYAVYHSRNGPT